MRHLIRPLLVLASACMLAVLLPLPSAADGQAPIAAAAASWPVYGHDLANSRSAGTGGPSASSVSGLQQAWKFNSSNGDFTGTPVVADGVLVAGTNLGSIYALDAVTGQPRWTVQVGRQINGSAAIDPAAPGGPTVFVPVAQVGAPRLLALWLSTGEVRWSTVLSTDPGADMFGSPTYWRGTVYVGTSGPGNDDSTARGSVVAVDESSGTVRWRTFTVPPGHDGGAVWSTPAIDTATGRLYVGTGNAYHSPAADTTDSMLELSATSGQILAHFQSIPGDVWELDNPAGGSDYDFGSSPNLFTGPGGQALVGEGQKSGTYWALDRTTMRPAWRDMAGPGSPADGGISSTAFDGSSIYGSDTVDGQAFALTPGGTTRWTSVDPGALRFSPLATGNGVLYSADSQGFLTARDAASGAILTKLQLGAPTFGGISLVGRAVYVAVGNGPPSPILPVPSSDTEQLDGSGSIVAFGDTSASGGVVPAASAAGANTFSGTCQMSGTVSFRPALTNTAQAVDQRVRATGACTGTFTGRDGRVHQLSNSPAAYAAYEHADQASCTAGTDSGGGTVTFQYGTIDFTIDEVRAGPVVTATAHGAAGGSAAGQGNVSPSASPVGVLAACGGAGLAEAPLDLRLVTDPSISG